MGKRVRDKGAARDVNHARVMDLASQVGFRELGIIGGTGVVASFRPQRFDGLEPGGAEGRDQPEYDAG